MRLHRCRGADGRLPPRGQALNFGGFAELISAAYFRSLVLDTEVEGARPRRGGDVCAFSQNRHFW